jgi:hypothetical protein
MALRVKILSASGVTGDMLAAELLHENLLEAGAIKSARLDALDHRRFRSTSFRALPSSRSGRPHARKPLFNLGG